MGGRCVHPHDGSVLCPTEKPQALLTAKHLKEQEPLKKKPQPSIQKLPC